MSVVVIYYKGIEVRAVNQRRFIVAAAWVLEVWNITMSRNKEDFLAGILVLSANLAVGWFLRNYVESKILKQLIGSFLGVYLAYFIGGDGWIWLIISAVITLLWMTLTESYKLKAVYGVCAILMSLRIVYKYSGEWFGVKTNGYITVKSMHMYCTLRCCSIIYEIWRFQSPKKGDRKDHPTAPIALKQPPSILDVFCYLTFAPALEFGPFYTFQTYQDSINMSPKILRHVPYKKEALKKMTQSVSLFLIMYGLNVNILPKLDVNLQNYEERMFIQRWLYVFLTTVQMSCFLYGWWRKSECICIIWGIGGYNTKTKPGKGPTTTQNQSEINENWNYDTIDNGDGEIWFLNRSLSDIMLSWNVTVQWWLVRYCYTQSGIPNNQRILRFIYTQFVNVIWHGGRIGSWVVLMSGILLNIIHKIADQIIATHFRTVQGKWMAQTCKYISFQLLLLPFILFCFLHPMESSKDFLLSTIPNVFFYFFAINLIPFLIENAARMFHSEMTMSMVK